MLMTKIPNYLISVSFVNWTPALQLSSRLRAQSLNYKILQKKFSTIQFNQKYFHANLEDKILFPKSCKKILNHSVQSGTFLRKPWGQDLISEILQKNLIHSLQSESSLGEPCKCRLCSCECCAWRIRNNHHSWKSPNHLELYFVFPHVHKSWKST